MGGGSSIEEIPCERTASILSKPLEGYFPQGRKVGSILTGKGANWYPQGSLQRKRDELIGAHRGPRQCMPKLVMGGYKMRGVKSIESDSLRRKTPTSGTGLKNEKEVNTVSGGGQRSSLPNLLPGRDVHKGKLATHMSEEQ